MRHVESRAQAARRREGDERTFAASHFELSSVRVVGLWVMMFGYREVVNGSSSILVNVVEKRVVGKRRGKARPGTQQLKHGPPTPLPKSVLE